MDFRVAEDRLEDLPLDRHELAVWAEKHVAVTAGRIALAQHEGRSVDAVDWSILRHEVRRTRHARQRRQPIHCGEHFIGDDCSQESYSANALIAGARMLPSNGVLKKSPRQGPLVLPPTCGIDAAARVVAAEDDDGVVIDARFLNGVQDLTDAVVHLGDHVGKRPAALGGLADEIRVGDHRAGASRSNRRRQRRAFSPPRSV